MHKILLVQPVDDIGKNKFLPLAISYQWMYAQIDPWVKQNWTVCDVIIDKPSITNYVDTLPQIDMVAMSCYVWNWSYNMSLAKLIKEKYPECKIVIGGPNVNKHNNDFFIEHPQIDYAITGEGEIAFQQLLKSYQDTPIQAKNFFTRDDAIDYLPERLQQLDEIPSPILEGFYDKIFELYKHRVPADTQWQVTFETLRGCPYHCAFCDIGDSYWNKVKTFDIDRVKKEIDWMGKNKIEYVSVCDSNWGMLERDKEITDYVIQTKKETGYPKVWDVTWAKNNSDRIFEIAKTEYQNKTNLFKGVTFAFQSFSPQTLIEIDRFNLNEDTVREYLEKYRQEQIPTYSELIWPLPNETYESLKFSIQKLIDLGQKDFLMVHPLMLTPNAPMYQPSYKKAYGIKTCTVPLDAFYINLDDSDDYVIEYGEAVSATASASYEDVIKGKLFIYLFVTMYYFGWAHTIMEFLNKKFQIPHTEFVEKLLSWATSHKGLINNELIETKKHVKQVFEDKKMWGRNPNKDSNINWEYNSATSIVFDQNRQQLYEELKLFVKEEFDIENKLLLDLNHHLCYNNRKTYPYSIDTDADIANCVLGIDSNRIKLDHWDNSPKTEAEFHRIAYHFQRKNAYWRCSTQEE